LKKNICSLVAASMILSAVAPIASVSAQENSTSTELNNQNQENLPDVEFETVVDNDDKSIIEVTYEDGKTSTSEYDKNTGEIFFDGEQVATLTEEESDSLEESSPAITTFAASSYKSYVIGRNLGSGIVDYKYSKSLKLTVSKSASVVAIAASLSQAFFVKKPNQQAAALVAAASGLIALTAEKYTYTVKYTHYKDSKKKAWYEDTLMVYKGKPSISTLKAKITHYYGLSQ